MDATIVQLEGKIKLFISREEHEDLERFNVLREKGFRGLLTRQESMECALLEIKLGL